MSLGFVSDPKNPLSVALDRAAREMEAGNLRSYCPEDETEASGGGRLPPASYSF